MDVMIRDLKVKDLNQFYKKGVLCEDFSMEEETGFYGKSYLVSWINNKRDDILLVAEKEGEVIGFLFCQVKFKIWAMGENIYVAKRESGSGVDQLLFDECQKRLREKYGIDYIAWFVRPGSFEEQFVKKMGFEKGNQFFWWESKTKSLWPDHKRIKSEEVE